MKAGEVVFQKLLDGKIQYVVPLYQRTYSWEEEQWEQLWDDLLEVYALSDPRNHFIGSIVTQQVSTSPESVTQYILIDGQQRMTTLMILLSVLKQRAETETWGVLSDEIQETCLVNKYSMGDERIKLMPTQGDRKAFGMVVEGDTPPTESKIAKARDYFVKMLDAGDGAGNKIDLRKLHSRIVNHLDMVSIHLDEDDSPNRIFESLNNTGKPLSVADLIRNYLLMNISDLEQQEQAYNKYWYPMEQLFADGPKDVAADFFWQYLMMDGSLPRIDETYEKVQENIRPPTPQKALTALKNFAKFSRYYAQIAGLNASGLDGVLSEQVSRLNQWEVTVAYPFLMRAMDSVESNAISQGDLVEVMRLIESYVIRRTVCGVPTNQLRRIFAQMSVQVAFNNKFYEDSRNHLMNNRWPNNNEFRSAFVEFPIYSPTRNNRTNLVLWTLERAFGHKEQPEPTNDITIEHIMPQTLSREWVNELGANASEVHERWLHTIGNLTLSGYNPPLGNKPFSEKKLVLAKANFALSASVKDFEEWNETSIQRRGDELAELALQKWKR